MVSHFNNQLNGALVRFVTPANMVRVRTQHASLFHMKTTVSVTKSRHEDRGPCYLHLQIFSYTYTLLLGWKIKVDLIAVFFSKLNKRPLFNDIYCKTILV